MANAGLILKGWKQYEAKVKKAPSLVAQRMNVEVARSAQSIANEARINAPLDMGRLKGAIQAAEEKQGDWRVTVGVNYAAYMEFGTKSRYDGGHGYAEYAAQFKGKGTGDYYDFLNAILDWVKRKGISARYSVKTQRRLKNSKADDQRELEAAEAIAFSIIRHGVKAHPFLFPAVDKERPKFYQNANKALNEIT